MVAAEDVARFQLEFDRQAEQVQVLAIDEIDAQARVFDDVRQVACAARRHPLAGVGEQHGELLQPVEILEAELQVQQVVRLARQRHAVAEIVGRRPFAPREDLRRVVVAHLDLGIGERVVGHRHEPLGFEPAAPVEQVVVVLEFQLRPLQRRAGRIGEAGDLHVVGERRVDLDRVVDLLVEPGQRNPVAAPEVVFEPGLVVFQLAIDEERVAVEAAARFRVVVGLEDQLAELRARDRLRTADPRLEGIGQFPGDRPGRQVVIVRQQGRAARIGRGGEDFHRVDPLGRVLVAHAEVDGQPFDRVEARLEIAGVDLEARREGRVGLGRLDQADIVVLDDRVAQQQVRPQRADRILEAGVGIEQELASFGVAIGIGVGVAGRQAQPIGQRVAEIDPAVPELFLQVRERDRGAAALAIEDVDEDVAEGIVLVVRADISEAVFVGRLAPGLRVSAAQVHVEIAEFQLRHQLAVDQLAFVPRGVLDELGIAVLQVVAQRMARLLQRVADVEVGPAEAMIAQLEPEPEQAVDQNAVVGDEVAEIGVEIEVRIDRGLRDDRAVAPLVADTRGGDHAELPVGEDGERGAGRQPGGPVDRQLLHFLGDDEVGVAQLLGNRLLVDLEVAHPQAAVEELPQRGRCIARSVVEAEPVEIRTVIVVTGGKCGLFVAADPGADFQEAFVGDGAGGEVDHAAAELAREIGRIGLLHQAGCDHVGREDVQRDHAAQRLRAGEGEAVQQRERIAIAEAADVDEALSLHRKAGDPAQRAGNVAFAGPRDLLAGQDGNDLGRAARHVARAPAGDDDLAPAAGNGDFRFLRPFGLVRRGAAAFGIRCPFGARTGRRDSALRQCGAGEGECGGEQKQPRQLLAGGHDGSPLRLEVRKSRGGPRARKWAGRRPAVQRGASPVVHPISRSAARCNRRCWCRSPRWPSCRSSRRTRCRHRRAPRRCS